MSIFDVTNYGAIGDGIKDNTIAMLSCISACEAGSILYIPPGVYKITSTLYIPANIYIEQKGLIKYYGNVEEPCMVIGTIGSSNTANLIGLKAYRQNMSNWTDEKNIGIKLINSYNSKITIDDVRNFTIGVQCIGIGESIRGFACNNIELGIIADNKIQLDLNANNGYVNENLFINGRLTTSAVNRSQARYGIRITKDSDSETPDGNFFIKPCIELGGDTKGAGIVMYNAFCNEFVSVRFESGGEGVEKLYDVSGNSEANRISVGYGTAVGTDTSTTNTTIVTYRRNIVDRNERVVFDSGYLPQKLVHYDDGGYNNTKRYSFADLHICGYNSPISSKVGFAHYRQGITPHPKYVQFDNMGGDIQGLAFYVDTSTIKRYIFRASAIDGYCLTIRCYDSADNLLTNAGINHPYVKTPSYIGIGYGDKTNFCGYYFSNGTSDKIFSVGNDVEKIEVIIWGLPLKVARFALYIWSGVEGISAVWSLGLEEIGKS